MTLRDKLRAELGLGANPTAAEIMCAIMTRQRDIENNPPPLPPLLEAEPVLSSEIFAARAPEHGTRICFRPPAARDQEANARIGRPVDNGAA